MAPLPAPVDSRPLTGALPRGVDNMDVAPSVAARVAAWPPGVAAPVAAQRGVRQLGDESQP